MQIWRSIRRKQLIANNELEELERRRRRETAEISWLEDRIVECQLMIQDIDYAIAMNEEDAG